jgi:membrane-associated phospholipid phosphatase
VFGRKFSKSQTVALVCSISIVIAEVTKIQLKFVFWRTWPESWLGDNASFIRKGVYGFNPFHGGTEYSSFPSGHMAATCAAISVLWIYYPKLRGICLLVGLAVGMGLVGGNYHFLSDVIAGAFVAVTAGNIATALWPQRME